MATKDEIALRIRQFGEQNYGSMVAFARALGILPSNLNKYLRGSLVPGPIMEKRLRELGCDPTWLLTGIHREQAIQEQAARFGLTSIKYPLVSHIWAGKGGTEKVYE